MKRLLPPVLIFLMLLAACAPRLAPSLPATALITPGETVVLEGLQLTFLRVLPESPCPENADCQTGGPGRIVVAVSADAQEAELQLSTARGKGQYADFQGYRLRLTELQTDENGEYLARIQVDLVP